MEQLHNLQTQIAAMEQEIEYLYAERRALVRESEALIKDTVVQEPIVLPESAYESDLDRILKAQKELPKKAKVACQGVEGAYSHQAADQFFQDPEITFLKDFENVFQAVEDGIVEYGVLPVENSTAGSVIPVFDLMRKHNFYIVKDTRVLVRHNLLTKEAVAIEDVKEVYSHPQALHQCQNLFKDYENLESHEYSNTAAAAKFVSEAENPHIAAIASEKCADMYGMHLLKEDVQDVSGNSTRFICISKTPGFPEDASKISLCLTLPHKPGALYHLLHKFVIHHLNLSKLESRPYPEKRFEYLFYLDIEGNCGDTQVRWLLNELNHQLEYFKFLGSYSTMEPKED